MYTDKKQMFEDIAGDYDRLNDIISLGMHSHVKKTAIGKVPLKSDYKILDVCCGTGDIGIYIAENFVKNGQVIGVDFSQNMLDIAKIKAENIKNISFVKADVNYLPFKNEEFDACFISFGLRNLDDFEKAMLEISRVTKVGGYVVNIDLGKPKGLVKGLYNIFFFKLVPLFGKLFSHYPEAYKYLPQSTKKFLSADELVTLFRKIGLNDVKKHNYLFGAISQQIGQK